MKRRLTVEKPLSGLLAGHTYKFITIHKKDRDTASFPPYLQQDSHSDGRKGEHDRIQKFLQDCTGCRRPAVQISDTA